MRLWPFRAVSEAMLDAGIDFSKTKNTQSATVASFIESLQKRGYKLLKS